MLVEAAAGCGKTELLGRLVRHVQSLGLTVLHTMAVAEEKNTPLAVLRGLVNGSPFPDELVWRFHTMSDAATLGNPAEDGDGTRRDAAWYELMRTFCVEVRSLSRREPVVVAVDDIQHGDADSLRQLLHLARHCCNAPLLLVFTQPLVCGPGDGTFGAELLRQPNLDRIRLPKVGPRDVAGLLAELGHPRAGADMAERCFAVSGGNPLLLRALLEDTRLRPEGLTDDPAEAPRAGQAYGRAVLTCLDRSGEKARDVAAGLAVLDGAFTHERLSRLLDISAAELAGNLQALQGAGIVAETSFQHPAAKEAVLDSLEPSHRFTLHQRSAELLHASGAAPALAAEHLRKAGHADGTWAVGLLQQAAEQALSEDGAGRAVSYLELAHEACEDPLRRAEIKLRLGAVTRRISVTDAERHVGDVLRALRTGHLDPANAGALGELLLTNGRLEHPRTLLDQGRRPADGSQGGQQVTESHENLFRRALHVGTRSARIDAPGGGRPAGRAGSGILAWLGGGHSGRRSQDVADTEGLLEITQLTDATFDLVVDAVWTLLGLGAVARALHWCDTFLRESAARNAPGWETVFAAVRAEAALHGGDLDAAERDAHRSLALLPERHRSAFEGAVIARLVRVQVARGDRTEAAQLLSRPLADCLPDTVHWLHYLRARGQYYLATRQYDAALRDFHEVGGVAQRWGMDLPSLLPWRTDKAEVLLRLGDREEGLRLAAEQLALTRNGAPRIRGISLRLQGLASEPGARIALLKRAVVELNRADDTLELSRTLFDLADAYRQARQARQAATALRRARQLAESCGSQPPQDRIGATGAERAVERPVAQGPEWEHLSESERRVATLAAGGFTNREISERLHITMSTVEQHLTRVYRKLKINGREELMSPVRECARI